MFTPYYRPRRLRRNDNIRRMVRETHLSVDDLILPLFVVEGEGIKKPIKSMPGNFQMSVDVLVKEAEDIHALGIPAIILFGIPKVKDAEGSDSMDDQGIIQRAVRAIKAAVPDLYVITDVCFCEYTDHGHCGPIKDNDVDKDKGRCRDKNRGNDRDRNKDREGQRQCQRQAQGRGQEQDRDTDMHKDMDKDSEGHLGRPHRAARLHT